MKKTLLLIILILVSALGGMVAGNLIFAKMTLDDFNSMAAGNFSTALALFRDDYTNRHITVFGKVSQKTEFMIDDFRFSVLPTVSDESAQQSHPEFGNMAAHSNGMVVMLACHWMVNGDPKGDILMQKLGQLIPDYKLSAPDAGTVKITELEVGSKMMISEARQWQWRMANIDKKPIAHSHQLKAQSA